MNSNKCKTQKRFAMSMLTLAFAGLLLMAGCDNNGNSNSTYNKSGGNSCAITQELKKAVKDYKDVFKISNGLIVVGSGTPMVDETGRNFYPRGCINMKGHVVIPIMYNSIAIGDGLVRVSKNTNQGGGFGLFDFQGNEVLPIEYEGIFWPDIYQPKNQIRVKKNGMWGLVDKKGVILTPTQYELINPFYKENVYHDYKEEVQDIFVAVRNGKREIINLSPEKMATKSSTPYDAILVGEYGSHSFMDYQGRIVAGPFQNVRVSPDSKTPLFPEGLAAVVKNNKVGFVDTKGTVQIPFNFYYTEFSFNFHAFSFGVFSEGLAAMMKPGDKWGYIDKTGKEVIPFVYGSAGCFHQGTALVGNLFGGQERYGLIDKNNSVVLPMEFESGAFTGNVYTMCQNGKWGVYSPAGACLTPCQYEQQITFFEGYADVMLNGKKGLLDEKGQLLIPCEYESVLYDESADLVWVKKNGKYGYVDLRNNVVVPIEFDGVDWMGDGFFGVSKNGHYGLYDLCGNCTIE